MEDVSEKRPSMMYNDGILQVSLLLLLSISPLQRALISLGMLHPPLGIPLSPHTQPGQDYCTTHSLHTVQTHIHRLPASLHRTVYKTHKTLIVSEDRLTAQLSSQTQTAANCVSELGLVVGTCIQRYDSELYLELYEGK